MKRRYTERKSSRKLIKSTFSKQIWNIYISFSICNGIFTCDSLKSLLHSLGWDFNPKNIIHWTHATFQPVLPEVAWVLKITSAKIFLYLQGNVAVAHISKNLFGDLIFIIFLIFSQLSPLSFLPDCHKHPVAATSHSNFLSFKGIIISAVTLLYFTLL